MRRIVNASKPFGLGKLDAGYVGENIVTEIAFDFTEWYEEYGAGAPVLRLKRFGDKEAYPVVLDIESGHIAVWTITSTDLQNKGVGKGQLQYMVDEVVKKSMVFDFMVENSLESTEDAPDPYDDWMDDLIRLTGESETNAYNAGVSATNAATSELNAATSETNAGISETNAQGYANDASGSANDASGYANEAKGYRNQASGYANDALGYKNDASGYASSASSYASDASGYADSAQGYANDASGYADDASGYANDAQGYASDASDSADSASASAEEAREYAEQTERSIPSHVRLAIYTLLENAAYATTGLTDEIEVVQSWAEEVQSLVLSETELELEEDTPQVITAVTIPYGATVSWTTSNPLVATVVDGIVTGASNGSCTITASAGDLSATCDVTVSGFVEVVSISAVYTQSGTVYDTDSVDSLKADLVVTATYSDSSTETIPSTDYTLSGTLTVGTSTITVVYGGKTTTFNVTVTAYWDYAWDYSMGKLEDQSGWHTDGTGTTELISNGEKISVGSSAYYQILMDNDNPYKYMPDGYGTLEVDCYGVFNTGSGSQNLRITAAKDSTTRLTLLQNEGKWKLLKNATPSSADNTVLSDCVDNTAYKVRIVLKGTTADVYLNGEKVASNVSATAAGGGNNTVMQQNSGSGKYGVIQTFKVHLGA